jgi:SAM-dependent methyltransferase
MNDPAAAQKAQTGAFFSRIAPDYDVAGPGCFAHFGRRLVEVADIEPGQRVLDVATGRGAVLFPAAERVGPTGAVSGIDLAEGMVRLTSEEAAHRGVPAQIEVMDAERLDFPDATFDRVLCGFGIMFFPQLDRALSEFHRVLKPGGRVALSTWRVSQGDDLAATLAQLGLMRMDDATALHFNTPERLDAPLVAAGFTTVRVESDEAIFRYADLEQYWQDARGTGLRRWLDALDSEQHERVRAALAARLAPHRDADGIALASSALLAVASR